MAALDTRTTMFAGVKRKKAMSEIALTTWRRAFKLIQWIVKGRVLTNMCELNVLTALFQQME